MSALSTLSFAKRLEDHFKNEDNMKHLQERQSSLSIAVYKFIRSRVKERLRKQIDGDEAPSVDDIDNAELIEDIYNDEAFDKALLNLIEHHKQGMELGVLDDIKHDMIDEEDIERERTFKGIRQPERFNIKSLN